MHFRMICLSQRQPEWVYDACNNYLKRLPKTQSLEVDELKPVRREGQPMESARILLLEQDKILKKIKPGSRLIALDEKGAALTSTKFANQLAQWQLDSIDTCFIIGSADGLSAEIKAMADLCLQLSTMTLPHALARIIFCEQFYRANSILTGHPYHRI